MKLGYAQEQKRTDVVSHEFWNHLEKYDLTRHEDTAVITHIYLRMGASPFMMMALDAALADFDLMVSLGKVIPPKQFQMREYFLALRTLLTRAADVDVTSEPPIKLAESKEQVQEREVIRLAESE